MKEPAVFLRHVLQSIEAIEKYLKGRSFEDFEGDIALQDSVMRRMEIIGEAVKNLPEGFKKNYSWVEWKNAASMRDVLIHQYFGVDIKVVWDTAHISIPKLKKDILKVLKEIEK